MTICEWAEVVKLRQGLNAGVVEQKPAALAGLLGLPRKAVYRRYESAIERLRQILLGLIRGSVAPGQHDAEYGGFSEWVRREFPRLASVSRSENGVSCSEKGTHA